MKDFGKWFAEQGAVDQVEKELPCDVRELGNGKYEARCRACEQWKEMLCDIEDAMLDPDNFEYWCGSGPSCCP